MLMREVCLPSALTGALVLFKNGVWWASPIPVDLRLLIHSFHIRANAPPPAPLAGEGGVSSGVPPKGEKINIST